jgi:hypothetical protein
VVEDTHGGGGGAGGYRTASGFSVTAGTTYTVTVGAGGAGTATLSTQGSSGQNSVFSSITLLAVEAAALLMR